MSLFQTGLFQLASGASSNWKIECDALTAADWGTLALMAYEQGLVRYFDRVMGVPRGGLAFARALEPYAQACVRCGVLRTHHHEPDHEYLTSLVNRVLVVDDVWTTGGSVERFVTANLADVQVDVLVAFARTASLPANTRAVWNLG